MSQYIKYGIQVVSPDVSDGQIGKLYQQAENDLLGGMGKVPEPFTLHSPSPDLLAGVWMIFRETLLAGQVQHGLKQSIATAVSDMNRCPWCIDAHSIVMHASGYGHAIQAVNGKQNLNKLDEQTRKLIEWTYATRSPHAAILANPPFTARDAPEIIGTVLTFHYLNRMVNAVLEERVLPQQPWLRHPMQRVMGWLFRRHASKAHQRGDSLVFLPEVPLPAAFHWAKSIPEIAGAFARFAAAAEAAGKRAVPDHVRKLVYSYLVDWDGTDPGISRQWADDMLQSLPEDARSIAKLVLLAAVAPHQISESIIGDFRRVVPADTALIEALAWGSYAAMRQISMWISCERSTGMMDRF